MFEKLAKNINKWVAPGKSIIALFLVLLIFILGLKAFTSSISFSLKGITGHWVNSQGSEIFFNADGTGFIPGNEANLIPSYNFNYSLNGNTLMMDVGGQVLTIEIKLEGDKMVWLNREYNTEYEYTRAK